MALATSGACVAILFMRCLDHVVAQTEFGWALTYDTYRKLYAKQQPVIPETHLRAMYKLWDKDGKNKTGEAHVDQRA